MKTGFRAEHGLRPGFRGEVVDRGRAATRIVGVDCAVPALRRAGRPITARVK